MNSQMAKQLDRSNVLALLSILNTEGVGNRRAIDLVETFGTPESVIAAPAREIEASTKINLDIARLVVKSGRNPKIAEGVLSRSEKYNTKIVTYWDDDYPSRLAKISDPPALLFVRGVSSPLYDYAVAVVGTRAPSEQGRKITARIAGELSRSGVTIISGLALGIDSEAHLAALRSGGRTIAVLGCGIDIIYPPSNKKLYEQIVEQGVLMTEHAPRVKPDRNHFPRRNRIISGLSLGVVVVEAGAKSGALITAKLGIEQGKELFAVPGPAGMPRSAGVNKLLKNNEAHFVETAEDVIEHLRSQLAPVMNIKATLALPEMEEKERLIYSYLEEGPLAVDELIRKSGAGAVEVNRILTSMQLKGLLRKHPGARVGRT